MAVDFVVKSQGNWWWCAVGGGFLVMMAAKGVAVGGGGGAVGGLKTSEQCNLGFSTDFVSL